MLLFTITAFDHSTDEVDAATIERAQRNPAEFAAIYREYVERVFYYLLSKADNRGDAEDITAQVFLDALQNLPAYQHQGHFSAWIFTIARHRLADFYRRRKLASLDPGQEIAAQNPDPLTQMIHDEHLHHLAELIAQLNDDERELLRLRFAAGLNFSEIAELQHKKLSTIKMSTYRLLARLKSQMEADHA